MAGRITSVGSEASATAALRWALVVVFLFFGIAKFAQYEIDGIAKIGEKHPLLMWMYPLWGPKVASGVIGAIELATAGFLILGAWSARAALIGGAMGVCTFLITLSILFGAPVWQPGYGAPFIGMVGQFLLKDLGLLAACYAVASAAARELGRR